MALANDAQVTLLLGDYIGIDAGGKVNAIGAGVQILGLQGQQTAPHHLAVWVRVPVKYVGQQFTLLIELRNKDTGTVASVAGPMGQPEALRVQQLATVERPSLPGLALPDSVQAQIQYVMAFMTGLPLDPGYSYQWRVEIDGTHRKGWVVDFFVPSGPAMPIFGGPAGQADIPGVQLPNQPADDDD